MHDTAPPSPAALAALDACAAVFAESRAVYGRTLHAVMALHRSGAVTETGHRSLVRLLEEHVHLDPADARRLVRQAQLLVPPEDPGTFGGATSPAPDLPATADALADGAVGGEHVVVVERTMHRLHRVSPPLAPPVLEEAERQLAGLARDRSPRRLQDAADEVLRHYDPDGERPHDADRPVEELRMHSGRDGVLTGRFRFAEPDAAEAVRSAIEARTPAPDPDADTTTWRPGRELHERRAEALRALVDDAGPATDGEVETESDVESEAGLDVESEGEDATGAEATAAAASDSGPGADELRLVDDVPAEPGRSEGPPPGRRRDRAPRDRPHRETTVLVTVSLDTLTGGGGTGDGPRGWQGSSTPGYGLLDGRWPLSPEAARRLACDAAVVPVVLGARGEVLDLGRRTRVVSTAQRRAVIARDRHCAHPGCRRSPRRCDVHHVVPWFSGGATDLDNLVLLCPYHHHQQHHSGWGIRMVHGRPEFVPPAWLDPARVPRSGHLGRPAAA